jgi:hypothetical protein
MVAALRRGNHVGEVLDGARADQRFEMSAPGRGGERRRHHDDVDVGHGAVQLGKAQVVADRQADAAERAVDDDDLVAGLDQLGFLVALVAEVEPEQVDLVIARHLLAAFVIHQAAVAHLVRRVGLQRHRAADQPDFVFLRHARQKSLDRTMPLGLARLHHIAVFHGHDAEEFRQHDQARAGIDRQFDELLGLGQIGRHAGPGRHLDGRHADGTRLQGGFLDLRAFWTRHSGFSDFFRRHERVPQSGFGCLIFCFGLGFGQSFHIG